MKLKNLLLIALVAIVFCGCQSNYQPTSITVASYNLRNANGGDSINGNGWGQRYPVIAQIVQYHDFDIFGKEGFITSGESIVGPSVSPVGTFATADSRRLSG